MRVSSLQLFQQGISTILDQQVRLQHIQEQLATGSRILNPADDPVGAVQILALSEGLERIDQYQRNANIGQGQLALEEAVLADVGNLLHRMRELTIQANIATHNADTRASIATEIRSRVGELLALANSQDGGGEFIFAGFQSATQPFSHLGGNSYSYNGDDGRRFLQVGASAQVAVRDSGFDVFMAVPAGNGHFEVQPGLANGGTAVAGDRSVNGSFIPDTYTVTFSQPVPAGPITYQVEDSLAVVVASGSYSSGETISFAGASIRFDGEPVDADTFVVTPSVKRDIFTSLGDIAGALDSGASTAVEVAVVSNAMAAGLDNIDQALAKILEVRADVGVRLTYMDNQQQINDSLNLQLQETLSGVQDLDYAEAISRLNLQLVALDAAQKVYIQVQGLSLFNLL